MKSTPKQSKEKGGQHAPPTPTPKEKEPKVLQSGTVKKLRGWPWEDFSGSKGGSDAFVEGKPSICGWTEQPHSGTACLSMLSGDSGGGGGSCLHDWFVGFLEASDAGQDVPCLD